ncbi:hypothetical protein QUF80_20340 [Desulfococcaceae bacterium HSG8]|nr:hypothetical protein [Desulfococcaceae bacterium HSG8]
MGTRTKVISNKKHTGSKFAVPPSGGITPPEGGTTNRTWYILFWKSPIAPLSVLTWEGLWREA